MGHEILISYDRNPLRGYKPKDFVQKIAAMLDGRASAVYLFGSFTTDTFSRHSDVDLFIITETDVPFLERPILFDDLLDTFPSLDILVYTPDEFRALTSDPSPGFWDSAVANMKRIV
ncbi:MAG: nucleotidyltransferase domain-containing protein [Spirochaetaceae bacterium]